MSRTTIKKFYLKPVVDERATSDITGFFIMIGIYKITSPSGKIYIGQSINIEQRFAHYKNLDCKNQRKLYNSFKKYGVNDHNFEIIIECKESQLNKEEAFYINLYKSTDNGLNIMSVNPNSLKYRHSEESRLKMSESRLGKKHSPEHRAKLKKHLDEVRYVGSGDKNSFYGRKHSEETKNKIRIKNQGYKHTEEQRERMLKALKKNAEKRKGYKTPEETKKKISLAMKGKRKGGLNSNAKECICVLTGEKFNSVKDAYESSDKKYSYTYFVQMINNKHKNKTTFKKTL